MGRIRAFTIVTTTLCCFQTLTTRESDVLARVLLGLSSPEIAGELAIGVRTVRWHLANAARKLGMVGAGRLRVAMAAQQKGLL